MPIEEEVRSVFSPEFSLKLFIFRDVKLGDLDIVEEGPSVLVDSAVVLVMPSVDVFALVGHEADELIDVKAALDGMVSQDLLKFSFLLAESIYMQDQYFGTIYHSCNFYTFLGVAFLTFVVFIQGLLADELEVFLGPVSIDIVELVVFELPLNLTIFTADLDSVLSPERFLEKL